MGAQHFNLIAKFSQNWVSQPKILYFWITKKFSDKKIFREFSNVSQKFSLSNSPHGTMSLATENK